MSKYTYLTFYSISCILLCAACLKPKDPTIPAYIHVPLINFIPGDLSRQGSDKHKFTDSWISVDQQLLGANQVPTTLPAILKNNDSLSIIHISAGIEKNGIASNRGPYPFFDPYEITLSLQSGKIDTIIPIQSYNSDVNFSLIDNFEGPGLNFTAFDQNGLSEMLKQDQEVFEGQFAGQLLFDSTITSCYVGTTQSFFASNLQLPNVVSPVYLEMHYKTDVPLVVGLISSRPGFVDEVFVKGGMNPIDGWNKIYFELTEDLFTLNGTSYTVFMSASASDSIPDPKVYVDNIKLVHY